jgi:non-homologous end joining protein Ku
MTPIRDLFKVERDTTGNLPPLPAIFPDQMAPQTSANVVNLMDALRASLKTTGARETSAAKKAKAKPVAKRKAG